MFTVLSKIRLILPFLLLYVQNYSLHQICTSGNKQKCILNYLTQSYNFKFYDTLPNLEQLNLKTGIRHTSSPVNLGKFLKLAIVVPTKQDEDKEETGRKPDACSSFDILQKSLHKLFHLLCDSNFLNTYSHLHYILMFFKRHWLWNWRNKLH